MEGASFDSVFDPEQAGIVCDRLAQELLRTAPDDTEVLRALSLDARMLLACESVWLNGSGAASVSRFLELHPDSPGALAHALLALAKSLFELAEATKGELTRGGSTRSQSPRDASMNNESTRNESKGDLTRGELTKSFHDA